jgi:ribosomal protein L11 methyltransferase
MSYLQVRFELPATAAVELAEQLPEVGALAVEFDAAVDAPVFDTGADAQALWPSTRVTGLFDEELDLDAALRALCRALGWPRLPAHTVEVLADGNWETSYRDWFRPRRFGDRLWVRPSWCTPGADPALEVVLDPGMAFGTGAHATTAMCLEWLATATVLDGARVIDYGCGSGILAIAAAKLGAAEIWAVDTDPRALEVTRANAAVNAVEARLHVGAPAIADAVEADIVVANILLEPLVELATTIATRVRPGGALALTGLLDAQAPLCAAAYQAQIEFGPPRRDDGWTLLSGHRRC